MRELDLQDISQVRSLEKKIRQRKILIASKLLNFYVKKTKINDKKTFHLLKNTQYALNVCLLSSFPAAALAYFGFFNSSFEIGRIFVNPTRFSPFSRFAFCYLVTAALSSRIWMSYCYNPQVYAACIKL